MDIQNINLLLALPPRQPVYFSFRVYKLGMFGLIILLTFIYFIFFSMNFITESGIKKLNQRRLTIVSDIEKGAGESQSSESIDKTVQTNIEELKAKLQEQEKIFRLLNNQEQIKFSVFLEAFAQYVPNDLWMTKIHIIPHREDMNIEGDTVNPALVSFFLHQLSNQKAFERYKFSVISIDETKEHDYHFMVKTKNELSDQKN